MVFIYTIGGQKKKKVRERKRENNNKKKFEFQKPALIFHSFRPLWMCIQHVFDLHFVGDLCYLFIRYLHLKQLVCKNRVEKKMIYILVSHLWYHVSLFLVVLSIFLQSHPYCIFVFITFIHISHHYKHSFPIL